MYVCLFGGTSAVLNQQTIREFQLECSRYLNVCFQAEPTQLAPNDTASPYLWP
jgi:hypothetical protein